MSSSCAATAVRPIRSNCSRKLGFGFGVFVVSLSEFIVGLQIVGADFDTLSLRMASEVDRQRCCAMGLAQQELDRGGSRRVAIKSLANSAAHRAGAVAIEQLKQMRDLMRGRFTVGEGPLQQLRTLRNNQLQTAGARGLDRLALGA